MNEEYNQSLPVPYGHTILDLVGAEIDLLTDQGKWQHVYVVEIKQDVRSGAEIGIELEGVPVELLPVHRLSCGISITAHLKTEELSTRIRRIVDSTTCQPSHLPLISPLLLNEA